MDCDDEIRLVKRHDHADSDTANPSFVLRSPIRILINVHRKPDESFDITEAHFQRTGLVFRVSAELHPSAREWSSRLSPSGAGDGNAEVAAVDANGSGPAGVIGD